MKRPISKTFRMIVHPHIPYIRRLLARGKAVPEGWQNAIYIGKERVYHMGEMRYKWYTRTRRYDPEVDERFTELPFKAFMHPDMQDLQYNKLINEGKTSQVRRLYYELLERVSEEK